MSSPPVTLKEIQEAKGRIVNVAYRTPLYLSPRLSELTNAKVYLKLESYQPIRVFKIRGATNKILKLNAEERKRGLIALLGQPRLSRIIPREIDRHTRDHCGSNKRCSGEG